MVSSISEDEEIELSGSRGRTSWELPGKEIAEAHAKQFASTTKRFTPLNLQCQGQTFVYWDITTS